MVEIIYENSLKGDGKYNEDKVGYKYNTFWIIDGATGLFGNYLTDDSDVKWMVNELNKSLIYYDNNSLNLEDILYLAVKDVEVKAKEICEDYNKIKNYELPSFAISLIRLKDNKLEYLILGDCSLLIELRDDDRRNMKYKHLIDNRLEYFSLKNKDKIKSINEDNSLDKSQKVNKIDEVYQNTRKLINSPEGYYIGSLDGKGVYHALLGEVELSQINKVSLFSDGLLNGLSENNYKQMFNKDNINRIINNLRLKEEDIKKLNLTHKKVSDDISVLLLDIK